MYLDATIVEVLRGTANGPNAALKDNEKILYQGS